MIYPQYTPFTEGEVRLALGLPRSTYLEALSSGALLRSVRFDSRTTDATALHSLVDIVRYDAQFGSTLSEASLYDDDDDINWWLDCLCGLCEETDDPSRLFVGKSTESLMDCLVLAKEVPAVSKAPLDWTREWTVLCDVVTSWRRCYLLFDGILAKELAAGFLQFGDGLE